MSTNLNLDLGVELRGVAKTFRTAGTVVPAVRGVDLSIAAGETVALLGPNGAGKSTTIDMMLGLARPDRGNGLVVGPTPRAGGRRRAGRGDAASGRADPRCDAARAVDDDGGAAP